MLKKTNIGKGLLGKSGKITRAKPKAKAKTAVSGKKASLVLGKAGTIKRRAKKKVVTGAAKVRAKAATMPSMAGSRAKPKSAVKSRAKPKAKPKAGLSKAKIRKVASTLRARTKAAPRTAGAKTILKRGVTRGSGTGKKVTRSALRRK